MGLITNITEWAKGLRRPARDDERGYAAASIRVSEEMAGSNVNAINPLDYARVARAVTGSIFNASSIIASECASYPLKLYRRKGTGRKKAKARPVSESTARFLRGQDPALRPSAKAQTMADNSEEIEEVTDHPVLRLLRDPDPVTTGSDFLTMLYWYREVAGKCYVWTGERNEGEPKGLYILHPQFTQPQLDRDNYISGYLYGRESVGTIEVLPQDVIYSRYMPDPFRPWDGTSWVSSIELYGDAENAALTAEISRWRNSGQPGMIVSVGKEYTDTQIKQVESVMKGKGGPLAAGRALILRDATIVQAQGKPHEMGYVVGLEQSEKAIYRAAGVPESTWKLNDANLAGAAMGREMLAAACYKRMRRVAEDLTEYLLPMYGEDPESMWFGYENPVREAVDAKAARISSGFSAGVVYVNEYRKVLDLEPVDDALNTLGNPMQHLAAVPPVASTNQAAEPKTGTPAPAPDATQEALNGAQVTSIVTLATQVSAGQIPLETAYAIAQAAFPAIPTETLDRVFDPLRKFTPAGTGGGNGQDQASGGGGGSADQPGDGGTDSGAPAGKSEDAGDAADGAGAGDSAEGAAKGVRAQLIPRWGSFACACGEKHKAEATTDDAIERSIFRAVQAWAEDALKRGISAIGPDGTFNVSALSSAELQGMLNQAIASAFEAGAVQMNMQASSDAPSLTSDSARQYVAQYSFDLVSGVTETMADQMRTAISDGLEKGQTINEIQQELTDKVPEISLARAETIARTETARAYQHGSILQAAEIGFTAKEWSLSGNPCGLCEGADAMLKGTQTAILEPFFPAGTTITGTDGKTYTTSMPIMAASELHPNCSCGTVTVVGGD